MAFLTRVVGLCEQTGEVFRCGALDGAPKTMITALRILSSTFRLMASLLDRIVAVISTFQQREAELRQQLADALADDAADDVAVEQARAEAAAATERAQAAEALVADLQSANTEASDQLDAINRYIASLEGTEPS